MSTAAAIRRMIEAGMSVEHALLAAEIMEQEVSASAEFRGQNADISAERRREKDRERKRLARLSAENPQNSADSAECPNDVYILNTLPNKVKDNLFAPLEKRPRNSSGQKRGTRLPSDWKPKPADNDAAALKGFPRELIPNEELKFRDWAASASGSKGIKLDWDAAWRNWLRNAHERLLANNRQGSAYDKRSETTLSHATFDRIKDRLVGRKNHGPEEFSSELALVAGR